MPDVFVPEYPDDSKTWGVDVSIWDDDNETPRGIDFNKMKAEGAAFVYVKAGQGRVVDQDFVVNWAAAKEAGLLRGAFWFLDARYSANSQAALFRSLLSDPGELPPCVDYEHSTVQADKSGRGKTKTKPLFLDISMLDGFVRTLNWPTKIIIYTGYYYWRDHGSSDPRWAEYPLWLAQYKIDKPSIPAPWKEWIFWQFTETGPGKALGLESNAADIDYFNGTKEQLEKFAGKPSTPPIPTDPGHTVTDLKISGRETIHVFWVDEMGNPHMETKEFDF